MEDAEAEESEMKKPHLNAPASSSSPSPSTKSNARTSAAASTSDKRSADASVLHYKNQQLVLQLDLQKQELHELEARIKALKEKQASYNNSLIKVNRLWNQCAEYISLTDSCNGQLKVIESLKAQVEKLEDEKVELQVFLGMYTIENERVLGMFLKSENQNRRPDHKLLS